MLDKIIISFKRDMPIFLTRSSFVTIMAYLDFRFFYPMFSNTYVYVFDIFSSEASAKTLTHFILKYFSIDGTNLNYGIFIIFAFLLKIVTIISGYAYIFSLMFISRLCSFKLINKLLSFKNFRLESEGGLKKEMKLIAAWILMYSTINLLMQILGISGIFYMFFATLSQSVVFYLLIKNNCFGFKITRRGRAIKI